MLGRLNQLQKVVEEVLIENYETRDSDKLLYYYVSKKVCERQNVDIDKISFKAAMFDKKIILPIMGSVSRCRRKLQENNPELWGDRRAERMALAAEFEDYSRE